MTQNNPKINHEKVLSAFADILKSCQIKKDQRTDTIESYLDPSILKGKKNFDNDNQARLSVGKLRNGLIDLFQELGSTHLQIGRNYPYLETREETAAKYLRNIKRITDKQNILNPGALGF